MKLRWRYLIPRYWQAEERDMREELDALSEIAGRRELGNLTAAAENAREACGRTWPEGLVANLRYALRTLRRQRSFTNVAVVSLALGIGANAGILSLMDALLWRDLPVREPERRQAVVGGSRSFFAYSRFAESSVSVMENVIASSGTMMSHLDGAVDRSAARLNGSAATSVEPWAWIRQWGERSRPSRRCVPGGGPE